MRWQTVWYQVNRAVDKLLEGICLGLRYCDNSIYAAVYEPGQEGPVYQKSNSVVSVYRPAWETNRLKKE
jgi:hypothetical protein